MKHCVYNETCHILGDLAVMFTWQMMRIIISILHSNAWMCEYKLCEQLAVGSSVHAVNLPAEPRARPSATHLVGNMTIIINVNLWKIVEIKGVGFNIWQWENSPSSFSRQWWYICKSSFTFQPDMQIVTKQSTFTGWRISPTNVTV